jgi:hypothetical protein
MMLARGKRSSLFYQKAVEEKRKMFYGIETCSDVPIIKVDVLAI